MNDPSDARWWPDQPGRHPGRAADVAYGALGPHITHLLVQVYEECLDRGLKFQYELTNFFEDLKRRDGRPPEMLFLMAAAVAAAMELESIDYGMRHVTSELIKDHNLISDSVKFLGYHILESLETFGFSPQDLLEYRKAWRNSGFEPPWPPLNLTYTQELDLGPAVISSQRDVESSSDPFAFWLSLRDYPSLVGAHLVHISDLYRYRDLLQVGLANVDQDLESTDESKRDQAKRDLIEAVDMVSDALRQISDAQDIIVRHFST